MQLPEVRNLAVKSKVSDWLDDFEGSPEALAGVLELCRLLKHDISMPPVGLLGVCNTILLLKELGQSEDLPAPSDRLIQVVRHLVDESTNLERANKKYGQQRHLPAKTALHGVLTNSPLYSLLYFVFDPNPRVLRRYQQVLLAALDAIETDSAEIKGSDLQSYSLGIRQLTDTEHGQSWLKNQDYFDLDSLESVFSAINDETNADLEEPLNKTLKLLKVLTGRKVIRRTGRGRLSKHGIKRISQGVHGLSGLGDLSGYELLVLGDPDDDTEPPHIASIFDLPKETDLVGLEELGIEHAEIKAPFEYIYSEYQELPGYAQAFNAKLKAAGAIKAIERQNQFLPLSTQSLTSTDLDAVKEAIISSKSDNPRLSFLLQVMLITASDVERARTLEIFEFTPVEPIGEGTIGFDISTGCWVLRGYTPDFATALDEDASKASRQSESMNHFLPEPNQTFIANTIRQIHAAHAAKPFYGMKGLPLKIKRLLSSHSDRLTPTRVSRYLLLRAAGEFEPTTASYIFSQYLPSSSARMFYTTPSDGWLATAYLKLRRELLAELNPSQPVMETNVPNPQATFGGRYCPKLSVLSDRYRDLTDHVTQTKIGFENGECSSTEFHNWYTAHCVITQGLLTGIRSVLDPFVNIDQIDPSTGVVVFRDKDGEDQFHTRIAPIHPLAVDVAVNYRQHRTNQLARHLLIAPGKALELLERKPESVPETFFLYRTGRWFQAGPGNMYKQLSNCWPWPLNSNRKYLRTRLLELGLEAQLVDLLLGHHARGEAFWDKNSTLIFAESAKTIIHHLNTIVDEIGLVALKGIA